MILFLVKLILFNSIIGLVSETHTSYKLNVFNNQIYNSYLVQHQALITENHSFSNQIYYEDIIPVEFIREISELSDLKKFSVGFGFGNFGLLYEHPSLMLDLPFSGTTYRVYAQSEKTYRKFVKLLSGFFNSEMLRPVNSFINLTDLDSETYFYHNSAASSLNFNMFLRMVDFVNNKQTFSFFSALEIMRSFEADYVAFTFDFLRNKDGSFSMIFKTTFILREIVLNNFFNSEIYFMDKFLESSDFNGRNLRNEVNLNGELFKTIIKASPTILNYSRKPVDSFSPFKISLRNVVPVHFLRHKMVVDVENFSESEIFEFKLSLIFKSTEYPILSEHIFEQLSGKCNITNKKIMNWKENGDRISGKVIIWQGLIFPNTTFRISIPYQQIQKNFEFVESDHLIANFLPSSIFEFKKPGGRSYVKQFKNIAYKTKNYDTTIVFAVVSVYLVIFFLTFNSITKLTE